MRLNRARNRFGRHSSDFMRALRSPSRHSGSLCAFAALQARGEKAAKVQQQFGRLEAGPLGASCELRAPSEAKPSWGQSSQLAGAEFARQTTFAVCFLSLAASASASARRLSVAAVFLREIRGAVARNMTGVARARLIERRRAQIDLEQRERERETRERKKEEKVALQLARRPQQH